METHKAEKDNYMINDNMDNLYKHLEKNNFYLFYSKEGIIYYQGKFYKPNISFRYSNINDFEMWKNIKSLNSLSTSKDKDSVVKNEKFGEHPDSIALTSWKWPMDSVFGVIIDEISKNSDYKNIEYLICDDLDKEVSDFIALNTTDKKLIFIHCKHGESALSASAFQDICGQAVKNLEYAITTNPVNLPYFQTHVERWEKKWTGTKDKKQYTTNRLVKGDSVDEFVNNYDKLASDVNCKREIWLVTSGLSKSKLEQELLKPNDETQVEQFKQLMFILHSTQESISQAGAQLKIICKP